MFLSAAHLTQPPNPKPQTSNPKPETPLENGAFRTLTQKWCVSYLNTPYLEKYHDDTYGYSPQGERLHAVKSGGRRCPIYRIAAFCQGQLLAPKTLEGAGNRNVFELWLETGLIPT